MKRQSGRIGICTGMALAAAGVFAAISSQLAAQAPRPTAVGFTAAQAERGQAAYAEHCASCHGANLDDGAFAPPLSGLNFRQKWGDQSPEALFTKTSTSMPPARPGSLGDDSYAEVLAYILRENGVRPGERPFPAAADSHQARPFRPPPRGPTRCRKSRRSPKRCSRTPARASG
jgi:mono/diheme cytochrome c family protein